jgi:glucose/arabinose dehydrogenase
MSGPDILMRAGGVRAVSAALSVAALLAGCGGEATSKTGGHEHPGGLRLVKIATLEEPISLAQAPGSGGSLYVAERAGRVRLVRASGEVERRPVLDLSREITTEAEGGLLSLVFDPGFRRNRALYVAYAGRDRRLHVDEFRAAPDGDTVEMDSRRKVLAIPHRNFVHWGGQLAFGPDGHLYLGTGDGGPPYPIPDTARDPDSPLGKMLRITPGRGRAEVVAMGLRNPWRYSFDRKDGDVWIGDVGDNSQEEIDHVAFEDLEGADFGWPALEGSAESHTDFPAPDDPIPPALTYERTGEEDDPYCAVTGGYVVRDQGLTSLEGRYLYADFCAGEIMSLDPSANDPSGEPAGLHAPRLASFGEDLAGRIYVMSLDGPLYRIAEPQPSGLSRSGRP